MVEALRQVDAHAAASGPAMTWCRSTDLDAGEDEKLAIDMLDKLYWSAEVKVEQTSSK